MSKAYIASVITPFHNTDMAFFKKGFDSLLAQTIGFESIEWMVVVHNSDELYIRSVRELTEGYENIRVSVLNNNVHSASSPRNYALDNATGKYLFFLDSDDWFMPGCIEEVVSKMEEVNAPVAKIRSTKELEDDGVIEMLDTRVRYDQTQSMIILHKGDPGIKDIMTESHMTPWGQVYLREFIEKHHLRYDEEISLGEDMDFTVRAMKYADPILVLPQTIGYVYYINHESTLQKMGNVTPEVVLKFAEGLPGLLDLGINEGIDLRYLFWSLASVLTNLISACPQLKEEHKDELRKKLGRYFEVIEPLDADGKIYTETEAGNLMDLARALFGPVSEDACGIDVEKNTLLSILHNNADTDIGKRYQFRLIHNRSAFEARVPLSEYSFYEPLIRLTTLVGEKKIFCQEDVEGYAVTFYGSGCLKRIPFNKSHLIPYVNAMYRLLGNRTGSTLLMIPSLPKDHVNKDRTYNNHITGAALYQTRKILYYNSHAVKNRDGFVTSPKELIFPDETFNPKHARLVFALSDPDVTQIVAPFPWTVLEMFDYLSKNYRAVIDDIRAGRISMADDISEGLRETLSRSLNANPDRAEELEAIFSSRQEEAVIPRIWPRFERIVAFGSTGSALYRDRLKRYTGEGVSFENAFYAIPEAFVGISLKPDDDRYKLLNSHDYFEFVPMEGDTQPVRPDELVPGNEYELIITNHAGLYRYRSGEVIYVEEMDDKLPVFTLSRRTDDICSIAGVRLVTGEMYEAVKEIAEKTGIDVADYCYGVDEDKHSFILWIEPSGIGDNYNNALAVSRDELSSLADAALCRISEAYAQTRESGEVTQVSVYLLEPETQILKRDRDMYNRKIMPDEMKPVRVVNDEKTKEFFMLFSH